eukprot:scaffold20759_cov70-Attheya_sp.AAC.1
MPVPPRDRLMPCWHGTQSATAPVHPVRNLMRRATMARKFACFSANMLANSRAESNAIRHIS